MNNVFDKLTSDSVNLTEADDREAYDKFQMEMCAYELDARGIKSAHNVVWAALVAVWTHPLNFKGEELGRQETLACSIHGWTLPEVYDHSFKMEGI